MRNTKKAFQWIIGILQKHRVSFQITGGFAARLYGSKRELADIDIDVPESHFDSLLPDIKEHIVFGPGRYLDDNWDLLLITLMYKGQEIDLCGAYSEKIFNENTKTWVKRDVDFARFEEKEVFGIVVPVVLKSDLLAYKSKLLRDVDQADIQALSATIEQ